MTQPHLVPLPHPAAQPVIKPGLRIGDAERDQTCQVLAAHFAAGRLGPAELDERTSLAVTATTGTELLALTSDLPPLGTTQRPPVAGPQHATAPARGHDSGRAVVLTLWGMLTAAAALCTMAVLFGSAVMPDGGLVWLTAFGTAVATSGITYFATRLRPPSGN
ncbi:DUF1707 SHOCT-like domain-containing protein [Propionibacteriaceae bacterium Y1923]|uniref:DUF1707 SHOCT-like domain-containing protein n=1 Tax=Aestuariimicrobium sp. Y1814 TaxID=3418742 RepID=UPI003C26D700